MLFSYRALDQDGHEREGTVEALSHGRRRFRRSSAATSSSPPSRRREAKSALQMDIPFFKSVSNKDVVILSRQIATLFEAQVSPHSASSVFSPLKLSNRREPRRHSDRKWPMTSRAAVPSARRSRAIRKCSRRFTSTWCAPGEESGKLSDTFGYLADYLDRTYEVMSKAQNALIYPAFVIAVTFVVVMGLMMTLVIPQHQRPHHRRTRARRYRSTPRSSSALSQFMVHQLRHLSSSSHFIGRRLLCLARRGKTPAGASSSWTT